MDHLSVIFLLKPPFVRGFAIAMFDYQRVIIVNIQGKHHMPLWVSSFVAGGSIADRSINSKQGASRGYMIFICTYFLFFSNDILIYLGERSLTVFGQMGDTDYQCLRLKKQFANGKIRFWPHGFGSVRPNAFQINPNITLSGF